MMTFRTFCFAALSLALPATAAAQTFSDNVPPGIRLTDEQTAVLREDFPPLPRLDPAPLARLVEDLAQRPSAFPTDTSGIELCRLADDGLLDRRFREALSDLCERHDVIALPKASTSTSATSFQTYNACSVFGEIGRSC